MRCQGPRPDLTRPTSSPRRLLLLIAAMAVALPACAGDLGSYFAPTAAVVGKAKISEAAVVTQLKVVASRTAFAGLFQGPQSNLNRLDARRQVLTQMVQQQAIVNESAKVGVSVSNSDVRTAVANTRQRVGGTRAFAAALARQGLNVDEFTSYERLNLIVTRTQAKVINGINAPADQIAAAYAANKATYDAEYHVAHILICSHAGAQGACTPTPADLELAKSVDERALAGNDFAALARQYTADTGSKAAGGDIGWVQPGSAVAPFEQAALALQPGQVTPQPVQSQFGYHIIKLIAKGRPLADAATEINNRLEQTARQTAFATWVHEALSRNRVRINPAFGLFDAATQSVVAPAGAQPAPSPTVPAGLGGP